METTVCRSCGGIVHGDATDKAACHCGHAPAAAGEKVCCKCGKNLTGHTRYHDHSGHYWCRVCNEKDRHTPTGVKVHCEDCHKKIDGTKVDPYDGRTLCGACARERALDKSRPHRAQYREMYGRIEKRRAIAVVCIYLLIAALLAAVVWFGLV